MQTYVKSCIDNVKLHWLSKVLNESHENFYVIKSIYSISLNQELQESKKITATDEYFKVNRYMKTKISCFQIKENMAPKVILLFSGKRKSGKDFLTDHLRKILGDRCEVIKISEPIKSYWAKEKNLNLNELLSDSEYKEQYRLDMIKWSEEMRANDYGYFCKIACQNAKDAVIWIVSDVRRRTDIRWFKETYKDIVRTIRIDVDCYTRQLRGYEFKEGIDDAASECDLDNYTGWDLVINNGDGRSSLEEQLGTILKMLSQL